MIRTRFPELNKFFINRNYDYNDIKENNYLLNYTVHKNGKFQTDVEFIINDFVEPIISDTKEKILYFTLKTPKRRIKEMVKMDNLEIVDNPRITVYSIKKKCEEEARHGLSVVVIDYLLLANFMPYKAMVQERDMIRTIRSIAHDLNVIVIIIYQNYDSIVNLDFSTLEIKENYFKILQMKGYIIYALNMLDDHLLTLHLETSIKEVFVSE